MSKKTRIIITLATVVFAAIFFYIILKSFSWQESYALLKVLSWTTIGIFLASILAISAIKAARFFVILRAGNIRVPFLKTAMVFISSQAFTPLPGGEIGRAILFENKLHLTVEQVATPVYLQAVIEIWAAVCLAFVSIFFIKTSFGTWLTIGLLLLLVVLTVSILIPKKLNHLLHFFKRNGLKYAWVDTLSNILDTSEQFVVKKNGGLRWGLWFSLLALGAASHGVAGGLLWYIARLQGVDLSFFQSIFAAVIAVLIQGIFGIIPGGLGVTEGGLLGVLSSFGVQWNRAVIITLLYRILTLPLLIIIALLFLSFIYRPNVFRKKM